MRCLPHGNTNSFDNDTGMELTEEGINSVTPDIGSHDILTIRMEVYPPADREEARHRSSFAASYQFGGDSELQTDSSFTAHRTFGILVETISDSDGGDLGTVGPIDPGESLSYTIRISDTSDIGKQLGVWSTRKDLARNIDADQGYSTWDYTITDSQGNDVIVVNLASDTYEDINLGITLPENVEAGNQMNLT